MLFIQDSRNYKITHRTKSYMKTSWRRLFCDIILCKVKTCQYFGKKDCDWARATMLQLVHPDKFITNKLSENPLSHPSKKMRSCEQ